MPRSMSSLLIAGTSHTGKSTLAAAIGRALGWEVLSTDRLARHPGRPWPRVPPHVAEYYARLSDETIYRFLLNHHENMWPGIQRLISDMQGQGKPFVLEGSALRPDYVSKAVSTENAVVCLHADHDFLRARMLAESGYERLDAGHRPLVDKFITRSLRDNDEVLKAARGHGLFCIDVRDEAAVERFQARMVERLRR
ncbi:MAG: hypothetical protein R3F54_11660 [Alphaproteobacteria bacterium]